MAENPDDDIKAMSFEQALEALEKIVERPGAWANVPLDQSDPHSTSAARP